MILLTSIKFLLHDSQLFTLGDAFFPGADDQQQGVKSCSGLYDFNAGGLMDPELGNYFPNPDVKTNLDLGMEELRMLEETNVISDPAIEDALHNL